MFAHLFLQLIAVQITGIKYAIADSPTGDVSGAQGCKWQFVACLADNADSLLKGVLPAIQTDDMTVTKCHSFCSQLGYTWAGLEHAKYCFCDNRFNYVAQVSHSCNELCAGNSNENCGGLWTLAMYRCADPQPGPQGLNSCKWQHEGCYQDFSDRRLIPEIQWDDNTMSVDLCQSFCYKAKYPFAGVEGGRTCFCGYNFLYPSQKLTSCSTVCPGNSNQLCGGQWSINVYRCVSPQTAGFQAKSNVAPQPTGNNVNNVPVQPSSNSVVNSNSNNPNQGNQALNPTSNPVPVTTSNPDFLSHNEWEQGDRVESVPWAAKPFPDRFVPPDNDDSVNKSNRNEEDVNNENDDNGNSDDTANNGSNEGDNNRNQENSQETNIEKLDGHRQKDTNGHDR